MKESSVKRKKEQGEWREDERRPNQGETDSTARRSDEVRQAGERGQGNPKKNAASLETNIYHFSSTSGFNKGLSSGVIQIMWNACACQTMLISRHYNNL